MCAATWLQTHSWPHLVRTRLNLLPWSTQVARFLPQTLPTTKTFFNSSFSAQEHPSMIEMRNRPYPTTGWDTSLFEEGAEAVSGHSDIAHAYRPSDILVRAVEAGHYEEARIIRAELGEIGVRIEANEVFETIAVKEAFSLNRPQGDVPTFVSWWSLVPKPDEDHPIWKSHVLDDIVLRQCPIQDARETLFAALHAVYRGHARVIIRLIVLQAVEISPLEFVLAFLVDLRSAQEAFLRTRLNGEQLAETTRTDQSRLYDQVSELLVRKNRHSDAARVLLEADKLGLQPSLKACQEVTNALRSRNSTYLLPKVLAVADKQGLLLSDHQDGYLVMDEYGLRQNLIQILHTLRNGSLPPVMALKAVMHYCYSSGNYQAMETIRREFHSHAHGDTALLMWARVELLCFMLTGQKDATLAAFFKYFRAVGTPRLDVVRKIQDEFHKRKRNDPGKARADPRSELFVPVHLRGTDPTLKSKLDPTRFHNIFVWQALAHMCTRQSLLFLYADLLRAVEEAKPSGSTGSPPVQSEPPQTLFDAVHFNLFIRLFHLRHLPQHAYNVLEDMERLGVAPDLETYSTLLKGLHGDPYRTQVILRKARKAFNKRPPGAPLPHFIHGERGVAHIRGTKRAIGPLMLFTSSLQAAIDHGHLTSAKWIYRKIKTLKKEMPEHNPIVETTIRRFRQAWRESRKPSASSLPDEAGTASEIAKPIGDGTAEKPVTGAVQRNNRGT